MDFRKNRPIIVKTFKKKCKKTKKVIEFMSVEFRKEIWLRHTDLGIISIQIAHKAMRWIEITKEASAKKDEGEKSGADTQSIPFRSLEKGKPVKD